MKSPKIKPREYQKECLAAIDEAVANGEKRALIVMASGLGKTYTSAFAVEKFFAGQSFGRVLVLCHSEKILRQTKDKFKKYFGEEFSYGMYANYDKTARPTNFLFATFQTMKENRQEFSKDEFSYIIVDEAHHSRARTYFPTICYFKPKFLLGLTATPDRLDGQKIEGIYGEPVYKLGFIEATNRGLVAECDYRLVLDDLSQERLDEYLAGDEKVSIKQLNRTLFVKKRDEEIVRLIGEYSAEVENPKTMIFCRTIEHARKIARLMGDKSVLVHKRNSDSMNDYALKAFKDGEINTVISVDMLNEGVDIPDANIIVFLRNTVSPAVFYQQLGRGTRLAKGKDKVKVLDFVNNCERIKMVLELKQEIDDFKTYLPHGDEGTHGDGDANSREKFTLNIATSEFKTRVVDIIELLAEKPKESWTQEKIVQGLQEMYQKGEKVTLKTVANNLSLPSPDVIRYAFGGSFNNALKAANIPINVESSTMSREDMLLEGKVMHARGEKITCGSIDNNPRLPNRARVRKTFGSIREFVELCGERVEIKNNPLRTEMVWRYWSESKKSGHWLTLVEVGNNANLATMKRYQKEFGCRENLIVAAEEEYGPLMDKATEETYFQKIKEQYAQQYYDASVSNGYWLRSIDFSSNGLKSNRQYQKYFPGGHQELMDFTYELYGDLPNYKEGAPKRDRPSQLFIRQYHECSKEAGHWLSLREIASSNRLASASKYQKLYKSLQVIRQKAIEAYGDLT